MTSQDPTPQRRRDDGTTYELPDVPAAAAAVFGERLPLAVAYVERLADSGVSHGLIGPREVPRLWERHVLNSAVLAELVPPGASVVDVGSGAGLPGIPLAIARPDLQVTLVEPLQRRTVWLEGTVAALGLGSVTVRRGKAEAFHGELLADVGTARAVSRLANLAAWIGPLVREGGALLALKGSSAAEEMAQDARELAAYGLVDGRVLLAGEEHLDVPTTVAAFTRGPAPQRRGGKSRRRRAGR